MGSIQLPVDLYKWLSIYSNSAPFAALDSNNHTTCLFCIERCFQNFKLEGLKDTKQTIWPSISWDCVDFRDSYSLDWFQTKKVITVEAPIFDWKKNNRFPQIFPIIPVGKYDLRRTVVSSSPHFCRFEKNITGWWFEPSWKIWKSIGMIFPNIWKNPKCSKPPTR